MKRGTFPTQKSWHCVQSLTSLEPLPRKRTKNRSKGRWLSQEKIEKFSIIYSSVTSLACKPRSGTPTLIASLFHFIPSHSFIHSFFLIFVLCVNRSSESIKFSFSIFQFFYC